MIVRCGANRLRNAALTTLAAWCQQHVIGARQHAELGHAQMAIDEADMADQRDPFITEQAYRKIRLEVAAMGRDALHQRIWDRPFARQHVLMVERRLIAAESVVVPALVIEILAELDQIVVDQELAGMFEFPGARRVSRGVVAAGIVLMRHHRARDHAQRRPGSIPPPARNHASARRRSRACAARCRRRISPQPSGSARPPG